jgi:thioredoxin-related protein
LENKSGIHFERDKTWQQILGEARKNGKYILLVLSSPAMAGGKSMDTIVFASRQLGDFINQRFISVEYDIDYIRMRDPPGDSAKIIADRLIQDYTINTFPAFLYFDEDGELVLRDFGLKNVEDFRLLSQNALDPHRQYYRLLKKYMEGEKDYLVMPYLVREASMLNEPDVKKEITDDYLNNYLYKLRGEGLFTKEHILFMASVVRKSGEEGFSLFCKDSSRIDATMGRKGYSRAIVNTIITAEEITPYIMKDGKFVDGEPDWRRMTAAIGKKFGPVFSNWNIVNAKIRWYQDKKRWPELINITIEKIDTYGIDTVGFVARMAFNNMVYDVIFMHSDDKVAIDKAIHWMEWMLRGEKPEDFYHIDTYANLLYKAGRKEEAIQWEKKAAASSADSDIQKNLERMESGQKTW